MPNPIRHWELVVDDVAKAKRFYAGVFHWRFDDRYPGYTLIDTGEGAGGGMVARAPDAPAAALHAYFDVADVQKTLRAVVEAGGQVIVPKTEIPGIGWIAMFLDPDRIPIGVLERAPANEAVPGWTELRRLAGELEVKLHLAGMEMRDRWQALQPRLVKLEQTIDEAGGRAAQVVSKELADVGAALRALLDDVDGDDG